MSNVRWVPLLMLLAVVGGCGNGGGQSRNAPADPPPSRPASASSPPLSTTDLPTIDRPSGPPTAPTDTFEQIAVAGVVTEGRKNCLLLVTDLDIRYVLRGPVVEKLREGNAVKLQGRARGDYDDTCAGIIFDVTEILGRS